MKTLRTHVGSGLPPGAEFHVSPTCSALHLSGDNCFPHNHLTSGELASSRRFNCRFQVHGVGHGRRKARNSEGRLDSLPQLISTAGTTGLGFPLGLENPGSRYSLIGVGNRRCMPLVAGCDPVPRDAGVARISPLDPALFPAGRLQRESSKSGAVRRGWPPCGSAIGRVEVGDTFGVACPVYGLGLLGPRRGAESIYACGELREAFVSPVLG